MRLVPRSGREVQRLLVARHVAIPENDRPQTVDRDWAARPHVTEPAAEIALAQGVGVDPPIAEVAHQQVTGEFPEAWGRDRQTRGGIELPKVVPGDVMLRLIGS